MGTTDEAIARRRSLRLVQMALSLFDTIRQDPMLGRDDIEAMARAFYALRLEEDRDARFAFGRAHAVDDAPAYPINHAARLDRTRRQLAYGDHRDILPRAKTILADLGGATEDGSRQLAVLCEHLLRAEVEALQRAVERDQGVYWGEPNDPLFQKPAIPVAMPSAAPEVSCAPTPSAGRPAGLGPKAELDVEAIAEAAIAEKRLADKMAGKYRAAARALIDVVDRKPVWQYTEEDILQLKDTLLNTPARFNTQHKFISIHEAAEENRHRCDAHRIDSGQPKPLPPMSTKTINSNYLSPLRQIFGYAAGNRATPNRINVAANVRAATTGSKSKEHKADKRLPFAHEALVTLFTSPLFTGTKSAKRLFLEGDHLEAGWRFWLPLVMFLMGLRPNELGQAEVGDVTYAFGWPCLRVTTDVAGDEDDDDSPGKRVKSAAGERTLPIHPELLRLGFLEHIDRQRNKGEARIFSDWKPGCDGTYSMTSSKVFNRDGGYLKRIGVKSRRHALYSLRHSYKNTLRRSELRDDQQNLLMGHEDSTVAGIYGSREMYVGLVRAVIGLDLDGITLDHIQPRSAVQYRTYRVGSMTVHVGDRVWIEEETSSAVRHERASSAPAPSYHRQAQQLLEPSPS
ncbi:site-specific integrase [Azospirillum sp. B2RO_4]